MRRLTRPLLPARTSAFLARCQSRADTLQEQGTLDIDREWRNARQCKALADVLGTLRTMSGPHWRCMYCTDSHGCDIEHFRPKKPYPAQAFHWLNLLLCCTTCNRKKGDQFPTLNGAPLLIDPTVEDPWQHLDFEPESGLIKARYDAQSDQRSPKGLETVRLLALDRREVTVGHSKTFRRLKHAVQRTLAADNTPIPASAFITELLEEDDHGLLPWCFGDIGRTVEPFSTLRVHAPETWAACEAALR
jgi:uncharacterized protein (TIGR02646 family)